MMIRTAVVLLGLSLCGIPAYASDTTTDSSTDTPAVPTELAIVAPHRPAVLPALYVSLAGLQAFDVYASRRGLANGAQEGNPLMQGIVNNPAAFWTIKAATTIAPMIIAERLWKKNKAGAIALMVVANGVAVAVAAHNTRLLAQQR